MIEKGKESEYETYTCIHSHITYYNLIKCVVVVIVCSLKSSRWLSNRRLKLNSRTSVVLFEYNKKMRLVNNVLLHAKKINKEKSVIISQE